MPGKLFQSNLESAKNDLEFKNFISWIIAILGATIFIGPMATMPIWALVADYPNLPTYILLWEILGVILYIIGFRMRPKKSRYFVLTTIIAGFLSVLLLSIVFLIYAANS